MADRKYQTGSKNWHLSTPHTFGIRGAIFQRFLTKTRKSSGLTSAIFFFNSSNNASECDEDVGSDVCENKRFARRDMSSKMPIWCGGVKCETEKPRVNGEALKPTGVVTYP